MDILCRCKTSDVLTEEYNVMVKTEKLIGVTEYVTQ